MLFVKDTEVIRLKIKVKTKDSLLSGAHGCELGYEGLKLV